MAKAPCWSCFGERGERCPHTPAEGMDRFWAAGVRPRREARARWTSDQGKFVRRCSSTASSAQRKHFPTPEGCPRGEQCCSPASITPNIPLVPLVPETGYLKTEAKTVRSIKADEFTQGLQGTLRQAKSPSETTPKIDFGSQALHLL